MDVTILVLVVDIAREIRSINLDLFTEIKNGRRNSNLSEWVDDWLTTSPIDHDEKLPDTGLVAHLVVWLALLEQCVQTLLAIDGDNGALIITVSNPKSVGRLSEPLLDKIPLIGIVECDKLHSHIDARGIRLSPIETSSLKLDIAWTYQSLDKTVLDVG